VAVPTRVLNAKGWPRYQALKKQIQQLQSMNEGLRHEIGNMKQNVRALRTDLGTVEKVARDELGMIRDGEIVFQFGR
jgi:cell division protein FtsB